MFALTSSAPFVHQHQQPQHHQSTYQQTKLPALTSSVSFGGASGAEARSLPPPPLALGTASSGATQSGVLPSPAAHFYSHHYGPSTTSMTSPAAGQDTHSTGIEAESLELAKRANPVKLETGNATADGSCRSAPATSSNFPGSALANGAGEATTIDSLSDAQRPIASAITASPSILPPMSDRLERFGSTNDQSSNVETGSSSASGDNAAWTRGTATGGLPTNSNPAGMSSSSYNGSAAGNIAPSGLTGSLGGPHANQPGATRLSGDSGRFAFYPSDSSSSGHPRDTHHSGSSSSAWDHTQSTTPITPYGPPPPHSAHSGVDTNTPSTATTSGPYAQQRGSVSYYQPAGSIAQQAHQNFASDRATSPSHPLWAASEPNSPNVPQTASAPSTSHGYPQGQPRGMPMSYSARPSYGQSVARISTPTYASMATGAGSGAGGGGGGPFTAGPAGPVPSYMGGAAGLYHSADVGHGQMMNGPQRTYMSQQGAPQSGHQGYNSQHFANAYGHSAPFLSSGYPGQTGMMGMQGAHAPHSAPLPSDPIIQDSYGNTVEFRTHYFNPFEVKHRRRTTKAQFKVLEGTFKETPKPTAAVRKHIAEELGMPTRAVQIWFQNRRAKAKASAKKDQDKTKKEGAASSDVKPGQVGDGSGASTSEASAPHRPSGGSVSFDSSFGHSSSVESAASQPHESSVTSANAASHGQSTGMYGERGSFSGPSSASFYPDNSGTSSSHQGGGSTSNTPRYAPPYHPSDGSWRSYQ
ncbi:hypothetical protein IE81DRAFT_329545 [Ceraceosorus guamensis]|uniref:Homeobox domain-containing protein n=1 Tax=Ceraceosorus guamensis TaxID=1522189 RepID=A0A316W2T3_9BASI|nr:hypothetical protein IE81DRAFT_329545 [Ceraceosorus guamensis]PWN43408.1 hypothetical protein IE81DRAFT_329545 [Ceraceosorus guamensis]